MVELLLFVAGAICSLVISHYYYRRSSSEAPEWARTLIERLPDKPPTEEELLRLFQESLQSGKATPDPLLGHVACPNCKAPSSGFNHDSHFDIELNRGVVHVSCPSCGWSDVADI